MEAERGVKRPSVAAFLHILKSNHELFGSCCSLIKIPSFSCGWIEQYISTILAACCTDQLLSWAIRLWSLDKTLCVAGNEPYISAPHKLTKPKNPNPRWDGFHSKKKQISAWRLLFGISVGWGNVTSIVTGSTSEKVNSNTSGRSVWVRAKNYSHEHALGAMDSAQQRPRSGPY